MGACRVWKTSKFAVATQGTASILPAIADFRLRDCFRIGGERVGSRETTKMKSKIFGGISLSKSLNT